MGILIAINKVKHQKLQTTKLIHSQTLKYHFMRIIATFCFLAFLGVWTTTVCAQSDYEKTKTEITQALGTFPSFMKAVPAAMLSSSWQHFTNYAHPDNVIPGKYMELAKLAVASQIPCSYCVHAHTVNAKAAGATDEEIKEIIMHAAWVRHWSTVLNGASVDFEAFKKEYKGIIEYMSKK